MDPPLGCLLPRWGPGPCCSCCSWPQPRPRVLGAAAGLGAGLGGHGGWRALTLRPLPVCSVNQTFFEIEENTTLSAPLLDIYVPEDQQVTLGSSSTLFAFRIQGTQLFLNITPDYEVLVEAGLVGPLRAAGQRTPKGPCGHMHSSQGWAFWGPIGLSVPRGPLGPQAWLRAALRETDWARWPLDPAWVMGALNKGRPQSPHL